MAERIVFKDINLKRVGHVDLIDGKLVPSKSQEGSVEDWLYFGGTPEAFIERYKDYTNGHETSILVDSEHDATA